MKVAARHSDIVWSLRTVSCSPILDDSSTQPLPRHCDVELSFCAGDTFTFTIVRWSGESDLGLDVRLNGDHIAVVPIPEWFQLPLLPGATIPLQSSLEIGPPKSVPRPSP